MYTSGSFPAIGNAPERTSALHAETLSRPHGREFESPPAHHSSLPRAERCFEDIGLNVARRRQDSRVAEMSLDQSSIPGLGKGRLEALIEGVFATVMTVLVLSLSVPVIANGV